MRRTSLSIALVAMLVVAGCATTGGPRGPATAGSEVGLASFYGREYDGRPTASGVPYDQDALTAAHRSLPFGTRVRVTNLANGRGVTLTVNDRGPFARGRIVDVSRRAARELGFLAAGTTRVRVEVVPR